MHFRSCILKSFGHFKEVSFEDLSDRIVVLLGPNEAGKSTFFEFLQTMLYGIYPTNPDRHKYTPRDGAALEGSAEIVLSSGDILEVSRRLARVPQGHLTNGTDTDLRNKAIPAANFISSKVFDAIFALDLHDMTGLEGRAWGEVQDRLLGGMNLDFLRSARNVVEEVEREANELWRPDRRGRPLERRLREERDGLSTTLGEAQQRESALQDLAGEIESAERRIAELRVDLPRLQAEARRVERIGPIAKRWRKIESLRKEAGDVDRYRHVPENPAAILKEWHRREEEYVRQLKNIEEQIEQSEHDQLAVQKADETIVRFADEIRGWSKRLGAHETNLAALRSVGTRLCELRLRIHSSSRRLAGPESADALVTSMRDWVPAPLEHAIDKLQDATDRLSLVSTRDADLAAAIDRRRPFIPVVVIAAGALLAAVGVLRSISPVWMAGGAIGLVGIVWLAYELAKSSSLRSERDRLQLPQAKAVSDDLLAHVDAELAKLHISPEWRERPNEELVTALLELRDLVARRTESLTQARALTSLLDADRLAMNELTTAAGRRPHIDVIGTVENLQTELEEAVDRVRRAEGAKQRLFRLNRDREHVIADRQALTDQIVQIEGALTDLGDRDVSKGISTLEERRRAKMRADHEESTLDKDHPGWRDTLDTLEALTDDDFDAFTDIARQQREDELDRLRQELNFESVRAGRKRNEMNMLMRGETPDQVESRIETIDDQIRTVRRKRDRLVLLANIIRRADQQFRYKHQPDVIRKASEYLEKITAGRYQRMILEDDEQQLFVFEKGSGIPIEVDDSMSQGTRDQVYLSIRFALMDHLDANQERLPACLDEVFVNWDENRRILGYEILKDLAKRRQVFVFTCHPWLAEELESVVTAQRIEL